MLTKDQIEKFKEKIKMRRRFPDWEDTDFVIGEDSFEDIEIDKAGSNGFWYFRNNKKGLIKRFVLENSTYIEKSCVITLIKKQNGKFTPRFDFHIWNTTNKAFANLNKTTPDENLIKARVDLNTCHEQFFQLINFIKDVEEIDFDADSYRVVDPSKIVITDENKVAYVKKLIDAGYSEDVWKYLSESNPSLLTKLSYAQIQNSRKNTVAELKNRLTNGTFSETTGPDSWQKWIYSNNWLFGVNYLTPIEKIKINITGVMPDFLFPTLDGFVDILEIKLPSDSVLLEDTSHAGAWKWSADANTALGQVVNYLGEIDRLRLEIEREIKLKYGSDLSLLKPRAYILIGNCKDWTQPKKEALRKMNHTLHGISFITYKELLDIGKASLSMLPESFVGSN